MKQFDDVDCRRGAPMGRPECREYDGTSRVRCFRVRMTGGGCYDDGGAYWGAPADLYHCRGGGLFMFCRAASRFDAKAIFQSRLRGKLRWHC